MIGEVRAVVRDRGFGFIRDAAGVDYFVHATDLEVPFEELAEGDRVSFESQQSSRGLRATEVRPA